MLLRAASFHSLHGEGYSVMHYATLALCWRAIAKVLTGVYTTARSKEMRKDLSAFTDFFSTTPLQ